MDVMDVKVDWISISVPCNRLFSPEGQGEYTIYFQPDTREYKLAQWMLRQKLDMKPANGRKPFNRSYHFAKGGFTYFFSDTLPYSLVEITGTGCDVLRQYNSLDKIIKSWWDRLTRIDIACDFITDIEPLEFANSRGGKRFKSDGHRNSESGKTVYVGTEKSDRFARVYRYNEPHPRAKFLRCEMVNRDDYAKRLGKAVVTDGIEAVVKALGEVFVWQHSLWDTSEISQTSDLRAIRETKQGNTERWLMTDVLSAIEKVNSNGGGEFIVYWLNQIYSRTGIDPNAKFEPIKIEEE